MCRAKSAVVFTHSKKMYKIRKQKYCFLYFLCSLIYWCPSEATKDERQEYIVYMGAIPEGDHSSLYSNKIQEQHLHLLQEVVEDSFLRNLLVRSYKRSFNAFAAYLTKQEQQKLASYDEVVSVFPSRTLWPQTTKSWDFIGLHENVNGYDRKGSDIIVGVLDSGIWPESESFSDRDFGPIPKKWKGVCHGGKNFTCNNKLIGARFYTSGEPTADSAIDTEGHGTHTASIAAGNSVKDASFYGIAQGTARGGVPSARIAAYKVCHGLSGCKETDILAAFDDAIADGVDIITISLGTLIASDIKTDIITIGSLHATLKGILTVHSAGNNGFWPSTVTSVAPWLFTVAASTMDRGIASKVVLGNGKTIFGKSINSFKVNGAEFPLVSGKDVTRICDEESARYCYPGCLDESLVRGKIVICESSKGVKEAHMAGAIGAISKSGAISDVAFVVPMPASVLVTSDLKLVLDYANSTKEAKAFISTSESIKNDDAPIVASFSSKGPNKIIPDILKPDITAPGVEILAAYPPMAAISGYPYDKRSGKYNILSGTSMSCPHVAGAATFVKLAHPDWSPSAIKSALMTTARIMDPRKHKDAEFSYGAGHISPVDATNPGLVYETSNKDYIKMLCKMGYSSGALKRLFRNRSIDCSKLKQVVETSKDLNYPSMTFKVRKSPILVRFSRTVTNVGFENSSYTARISKPSGIKITVEPQTLDFKHLNEKKSFTVTVKGNRVRRSMVSASLVWSDGVHFVRSPIVVY